MANNFCRFLSNGFRFESHGTDLVYKPCCWYSTGVDLLNDPDVIAKKQYITNINQWVPECNSCRQLEESGITNPPRLRSFNEIPDETVPDNVPVWIELSIDTTCNAACLMCGPWHSTTWEKQEIKFGIKKADDVPDRIDPTLWLDKITSMWPLDYINSISFLGGEPFKSDIPLQFLRKLKSVKDLATVTIHFQTNGSIQPTPALVELMRECHKIKYNLSLDGYASHTEYVRYPLKWKKIISTLEYVKKLALPNLYFHILNTVNPLNVYYFDQLENWAHEFFKDYKSSAGPGFTLVKPNRCSGTLDLSYTPLALRQEIISKFGPAHNVSKMFSNMDVYQDTTDFFNHINQWDQYRKTNWRTTFPEIVKYYE